MEELRYPIGKFSIPEKLGAPELDLAVENIEKFSARLKSLVQDLTSDQLDTPYRPNGWSVRQLVHHCADSHMNAFIRFRWSLTENVPTIKPYNQTEWAKLPDSKMDIHPSIFIIEGVHQRWSYLLKNISRDDFEREFKHPEHPENTPLYIATAMYAWHCNHHLAHISALIEREEW